MLESSLLGIDCHAAVVSDMFMASGGHVEQRGLAAIGISYQRNLNNLPSLLRQRRHLPFKERFVRLDRRAGFIHQKHLLRLAFTNDLDVRRLVTTK